VAYFRAYGVTIATDVALRLPTVAEGGAPHLRFVAHSDRAVPDPAAACRLRSVPVAVPGLGHRPLTMYVADGVHLVHVEEVAHLTIRADCIECRVLSSHFDDALDLIFQAWALPMWLECHGRPVLHGAVIETAEGAAAFVADSGTGKSTLVASLAAAGFAVVADDLVVPIIGPEGIRVLPGSSEVRLHPDAVPELFGAGTVRVREIHHLVDKHAVSSLTAPSPDGCTLAAIFVLKRRVIGPPALPVVHPLEGRQAIGALIRATYAPRFVRAAGLESSRLRVLTRVAAGAPVARLEYDTGLEHLPAVHAAIGEALAGSSR
jgi:hypothetical protein